MTLVRPRIHVCFVAEQQLQHAYFLLYIGFRARRQSAPMRGVVGILRPKRGVVVLLRAEEFIRGGVSCPTRSRRTVKRRTVKRGVVVLARAGVDEVCIRTVHMSVS